MRNFTTDERRRSRVPRRESGVVGQCFSFSLHDEVNIYIAQPITVRVGNLIVCQIYICQQELYLKFQKARSCTISNFMLNTVLRGFFITAMTVYTKSYWKYIKYKKQRSLFTSHLGEISVTHKLNLHPSSSIMICAIVIVGTYSSISSLIMLTPPL